MHRRRYKSECPHTDRRTSGSPGHQGRRDLKVDHLDKLAGNSHHSVTATRAIALLTGEDEDKRFEEETAAPLRQDHPPTMAIPNGPRTWRIGDLCDMWADASGRDRREILEQFVQDFFSGSFERGGTIETLAESRNERVTSRYPITVSVNDAYDHIGHGIRRHDINIAEIATLSIKDWEKLEDDGRRVISGHFPYERA